MEKNTFGKFLSALRKANGMTQKDLADKLNVSDKAVSRWERDENYPDLSLIPVIADIFNVTTDELLRGAKNPVTEDNEPQAPTPAEKKKSEKQIKNLLKRQSAKWYRLVAITGAIMACCILLYIMLSSTKSNQTFTVIAGFLAIVSAVAFLASPIIGNIRFNNYIYDFEECPEEVPQYKKKFFRITWGVGSLLIFILAFVTSELTYDMWDSEAIGDSLGTLTTIVFFLLYESIAFFVLQIVRKNKKGMVLSIVEALIAIILIVQFSLSYSDFSMTRYAKGNTYTDFEKFKTYVEADGVSGTNNDFTVKAYVHSSLILRDYYFSWSSSENDNYNSYYMELSEHYYLADAYDSPMLEFNFNNSDVYLIRIDEKNTELTFRVYDIESIMAARRVFGLTMAIIGTINILGAIAIPVTVLVKKAVKRK